MDFGRIYRRDIILSFLSGYVVGIVILFVFFCSVALIYHPDLYNFVTFLLIFPFIPGILKGVMEYRQQKKDILRAENSLLDDIYNKDDNW